MEILKLLILSEVLELLGIGKTKLYGDIQKGLFPPPIKIGVSSRWLASEVQELVRAYTRGGDRCRAGASRKRFSCEEKGMKSRHFVTPSPAEAPVIVALRKAGILNGTDDRMASFTCPMCQAIATYAVPSEQEPYGEVKCSCGLTLIQLLKELDMKLHEARCCPTLNISQIPIHEVVDAAEELLVETGKVVACGRSLYTADYRSGVLAWIDEADLTRLLSQYGVFLKHDARSKSDLPVDPPARMVHLLMSTQYKQDVPQVMGVVRQPFVLTDGSLCLTPGYHADLKVLAAFNPATFRKFAWTGKVSASQAKEPNLLPEIDHIIPVSKEGETVSSNLQTLCWKRNRSKSNKIFQDRCPE